VHWRSERSTQVATKIRSTTEHQVTLASTHSPKRLDIQFLRAVAVLAVVGFHLRPGALPGGFIGVDVFFVISGFLITGSLTAEVMRTGSIRLRAFWARRIRRLLPAATAVLVAVLIASMFLLPAGSWPAVIQQVIASAFSVQNWVLAAQSVDYLQASSPPTPVQHFWSLSVEEQFYAVWPFLLVAGLAVSRAFRVRALDCWRILIVVLFTAFLAWSIIETAMSPATAYFSTATRAWELLLGAALAVWAPALSLSRKTATGALLVGGALILASLFLITPTTSFPGAIAIIPTAGAALVIASGFGAGPLPLLTAVMSWRPFTYIGDISYSLYLWHWPVIVFVLTFSIGTPLPIVPAVLVVAASVALAALSARFIEQPAQRAGGRSSVRRAFVLGAALLALTGLFVGVAQLNVVRAEQVEKANADPRNFPGANVLDPEFDPAAWNEIVVAPIPTLLSLEQKVEKQLSPECLSTVADPAITVCEGGNPDSTTVVLLVGDSHAGQWYPALDAIGKANDWRVILAGKQSCTMTAQTDEPAAPPPTGDYPQCVLWNSAIGEYIQSLRPAMVIQGSVAYGYSTSNAMTHAEQELVRSTGFANAWKPIIDAGIPVVAIREIPTRTLSVPRCMALRDATSAGCTDSLAPLIAAHPSQLSAAAEQEPRADLVDMTTAICPDGACPGVIGNILTYRDESHLTAPFARSLTWLMSKQLRQFHPELFVG
jgi:peptidoglycan/LPS O-acetylase OafA/YrhL